MFKKALLILFLLLPPSAAWGQEGAINILYTGGIKGELEPCGCSPKTESGGLARLSGYIEGKKEELKPYILIDAGNSMGEETAQGRLKSEALLKSFAIMGYDDVAFLNHGVSPLIEKYGTPAVSMNSLYRSCVTVERGPFRINISSDAKGHKKGWLNILLTEMPVSEAGSAGYIDGWDVVVTSSGEILEEPVKAGGTVIVSGYARGRKLGILTVQTDERGGILRFTHRWQTLGKEIKEDARVRDVLKEYDAKVAGLVKDEERKPSSHGPYLGYPACAGCHQPFIEKWKNTKHAGAFGSLEKAGKSRDPECVKCHTTGYGEEGGFYSGSVTPALVNVQCEVCHGPGKEHAADFTRPMRIVAEKTCLRCHTKENSPDFDFKSYFEKIKH